MFIKKILRQSRRDFWAIYACEHCKFESEEESGYDDAFFHNEVIPKKECPKCHKTAAEDTVRRTPKYDASVVI